jgi:nifR3 family TIM-barrel protein
MAAVTNRAFRQLCCEQWNLGRGLAPNQAQAADLAHVDAVFVTEMITARAVTARNPKTFNMLQFFPGEFRSVQLYGTDPETLGEAARILIGEFGVRHIDLNFGCPVPKVTRKGGGGALPWKCDRMEDIFRAVVTAAGEIPVTVKTRIGIDDEHLTFLDTGHIAQECGIAAITLHARTVAQGYSGKADWPKIGELKAAVSIPVIGNGDIWEAADARELISQTGCDGVAIGRGCLGRPWLFRDLALPMGVDPYLPTLGEVADMFRRHGELLCEINGEVWGMKDLRKHVAWYFKGFPVGGEWRRQMQLAATMAELEALLAQVDRDAKFPAAEIDTPRGRQGAPRKVHLPYGWLDSRTLGGEEIADDMVEGG